MLNPTAPPTPLWNLRSARLWLAILLCAGVTGENLMRNSFSMAIVCMINETWADSWAREDMITHNHSAREFYIHSVDKMTLKLTPLLLYSRNNLTSHLNAQETKAECAAVINKDIAYEVSSSRVLLNAFHIFLRYSQFIQMFHFRVK
jgi:hypothetical protein